MILNKTSFLFLLVLLPRISLGVFYNVTTAHVLCNMTTAIPGLLTVASPWKCPTNAQISSFDWCTYSGILCAANAAKKVIQMDLRNFALHGSIPSTLGKLSSLKYLYLSSNNIAHRIPAALGNLSSLLTLRLDSNSLTGTVPNALTKLTKLTTLNLNNNYLTGTMPSGFTSTTYNDDGSSSASSFNQLTYNPTGQPTGQPSGQPSSQPTRQPTGQPTRQPTGLPTRRPSGQPTRQPTGQPTSQPTSKPSQQPVIHPTGQPSGQPTAMPSRPTIAPTSARPTAAPSSDPTGAPSTATPTSQPSKGPTPTMDPTIGIATLVTGNVRATFGAGPFAGIVIGSVVGAGLLFLVFYYYIIPSMGFESMGSNSVAPVLTEKGPLT